MIENTEARGGGPTGNRGHGYPNSGHGGGKGHGRGRRHVENFANSFFQRDGNI